MKFTEHTLSFACAGEELLGIVAAPEQPKSTGVLVLVGGPQYRVGSHRQFLLLARTLAKAGYPVMRFDYRGMGDSTGDLRNFEAVNDDIAAAINAFCQQSPDVAKIVLWGLCDAASASLLYCDTTQDARISGLVLLNPWVRSETTLARTHIRYYYGQRLLEGEFWRKLLSGKLGVRRALKGLVGSWLQARIVNADRVTEMAMPFQKRMMRALEEFSGPLLLILSAEDYTAKEFLEACRADGRAIKALGRECMMRVDLAIADHTFSSRELRMAVEAVTIDWLQKSMVR